MPNRTRVASASVRTVCQASVNGARASFVAVARGNGTSQERSLPARRCPDVMLCHQGKSRNPKSTRRKGNRAVVARALGSSGPIKEKRWWRKDSGGV